LTTFIQNSCLARALALSLSKKRSLFELSSRSFTKRDYSRSVRRCLLPLHNQIVKDRDGSRRPLPQWTEATPLRFAEESLSTTLPIPRNVACTHQCPAAKHQI